MRADLWEDIGLGTPLHTHGNESTDRMDHDNRNNALTSGKPRVLVAESDPAALADIRNLLEDRYELDVARLGEEAVAVARATRPDLVLFSAHLPDLDPAAALERLNQDSLLVSDDVPVIFRARERNDEVAAKCLNLGAVDYVLRSSGGQELVARIDRALRHSQQRRSLLALARTDALTGLSNFGALRSRLDEEFKRASRYRYPLAVVMVDLDHLKELNDRFGHEIGNRAVLAIARQLRQNLRTTDFAARYGGDEFVVLLPHSSLREANVFAERLRSSLNSVRMGIPEGSSVRLTLSAGIAALSSQTPHPTPEALLEAADSALYEAKRGGRDRVACYEPDMPNRLRSSEHRV